MGFERTFAGEELDEFHYVSYHVVFGLVGEQSVGGECGLHYPGDLGLDQQGRFADGDEEGGRIRTLLPGERHEFLVVGYILSKVFFGIDLHRIRRGRWGTRFWRRRCRLWKEGLGIFDALDERLPFFGSHV